MNTRLPENTATAKFVVTDIKPDAIATETHKVAEVVKQHPDYANQPSLQKALVTWVAAADTIGELVNKVAAARLALAAAILELRKAIPIWKRASMSMVAAVNDHAGGLPDAIKTWGFGIVTRAAIPMSNAAPTNVRMVVRPDRPPLIKWVAVANRLSYLAQIGDGTPEGWGAPSVCPQARYEATSLALGQKVAIRVAVVRKSGQSAWSDAVSVTVR